jgi:hypothetical protein
MNINYKEYQKMKILVSGLYWKFNENILKWYMSKIFNYEQLMESSLEYESFEDYYNTHTKGKEDLIEKYVEEMWKEANKKGLNITKEKVKFCLIVRMGNIYTGMKRENNILDMLTNLSPYIICNKAGKFIDTRYKIDCIVEYQGIDKAGFQIKPISFLSYDKGSENKYHLLFEKDFKMKAHYIFYKGDNIVIIGGKEFLIKENKNEIIKQLEKILVYQ